MSRPTIKGAEDFFKNGCGRCSLGGTPACRVNQWRSELEEMRKILRSTSLVEERKWGVACYTHNGKNIVMLGAFKECSVISFLKGALINDPDGLLEKRGEATQSARVIRITSLVQLKKIRTQLLAFIANALEIEEKGQRVESKKIEEMDFPTELNAYFRAEPALKKAFLALTPGRQRGYLLHFNGAKKTETRSGRIEKYRAKILSGKGLMD